MERHTLSGDRLPLSCSDFRVKPTMALSFPEGLDGSSRHFPWLNQITKTPDRRSVASMNKKLCYSMARAMRCVSHSLGNCRTSCTTNPKQIAVMKSELIDCPLTFRHYSKQPRLVDCSIGVQAPPLTTTTSFVDNAIDLPRRNFPCPEFGAKFQREVPLFLEVPEFPTRQRRICFRKLLYPKRARFVQPFRQNSDV